MSPDKIHVRPAGPGDRDQVWPLARDLATSYVAERPAFDQSYESLLAAPAALLLVAAEDWARRRGARYVALATRRAAPFYQALGYEDSAVYFKKPLG